MDSGVLYLILTALAAGLALCLFLIIKLYSIISHLPIDAGKAETVPIGSLVPYFELKLPFARETYRLSEETLSPFVIVFLSPACIACKSKIPELCALKTNMHRAGVRLFVVGIGREGKVKRFLGGKGLETEAAVMEPAYMSALNPLGSSPFYLLVDGEGIVQASADVGDDNWQAFTQQMAEYQEMA